MRLIPETAEGGNHLLHGLNGAAAGLFQEMHQVAPPAAQNNLSRLSQAGKSFPQERDFRFPGTPEYFTQIPFRELGQVSRIGDGKTFLAGPFEACRQSPVPGIIPALVAHRPGGPALIRPEAVIEHIYDKNPANRFRRAVEKMAGMMPGMPTGKGVIPEFNGRFEPFGMENNPAALADDGLQGR